MRSPKPRQVRAGRLEALERRWLLKALVLDVTDPSAYAAHAGNSPPAAAATAAAGNDDYAALNWLVNTEMASDILGRTIRIWDGGTGTTSHAVASDDTIGGLFFPAGSFGLSRSLDRKS